MSDKEPTWVAGEILENALTLAVELHADHARKADGEPYLGHLMAVASNVIEAGGTEEQAAAALLHDAIEDRDATFELIATRVNENVARIVTSCSEENANSGLNKESTWAKRKDEYLQHLAGLDPLCDASILVALADKVNNCEKTARDIRRHLSEAGHTSSADDAIVQFWNKFNAGDSCQEWWYRRLIEEFEKKIGQDNRLPHNLLLRLVDAYTALFGNRQIIECGNAHQHWHDLPKGAK